MRVGTRSPVGSAVWMGFGVSPDGGVSRLSLLAAVENAQHQHGAAVVAILECVRSAEHRQDELAVFVAMAEWASLQGMAPEHVCPCHQLTGDASGEIGKLVVPSDAASSAISWGTVTPSSAARTSSTSAVRRSMSMLTAGPITSE